MTQIREESALFKFSNGFTLIELLVVITIIVILTSIGIVTYNRARAQARDIQRIENLKSIAKALEAYYNAHGQYPDVPTGEAGTDVGCWSSWDGGNDEENGINDPFIQVLETEGFMTRVPKEKYSTDTTEWSQCSYRYGRHNNPGGCTGTYAVLYTTLEQNRNFQDQTPSCNTGWGEGGLPPRRDYAIWMKE